MSTKDRKARKREGIKFTKAQKTLTPPEERMVAWLPDRKGVLRPGKRAVRRAFVGREVPE